MNKTILLIAGEASGDLHGAGLVRALRRRDADLEFFGIGGDRMKNEGVDLLYHADDLAFIGFAEVIRHLPALRRVFKSTLRQAKDRSPDLIVLIDYPGFNIRFASAAKKLGLRTFYYIAPQVWAWAPKRVKKMARVVDNMAVIFEFEKEIFSTAGIDTTFVGHPLLEVLRVEVDRETFLSQNGLNADGMILSLLPGSRPQEVRYLLPEMLKTGDILSRLLPDLQVVVGKAQSVSREVYDQNMQLLPQGKLIENDTYDTMKYADAAIVASGTATLETACFGTPFVIGYRVSQLSYHIMKRLIRIPYIGLVNVVAGKRVVPEFVQNDFCAEKLVPAMSDILLDSNKRRTMTANLEKVREKLGDVGASDRTAEFVLAQIDKHTAQD